MIQLLQVTNRNELNIDFKQIYEELFPANERRDWEQLTELIANTSFRLNEIYFHHKFIGFITVWNLNEFRFIEHFAICETEQGKGFGTEALKKILSMESTPVILEVEEPISEIARNRIRFYEQLKFCVADENYYQPPYSIEKNKVKMLLMSYPEKIRPDNFAEIKSKIYQFVYHFKE